MLSLLPSVSLIAFFHGKKEAGKWTKVEIMGLPVNVIFTILLVIFMFKGKDLGAATTTVTVEDEEGIKVERTIFKSEFRKKIALFNFENLSNDSTLDWLQYTLPTMVQYDLSQDIFIEPLSAVGFFDKIREAGFEDGIGLPIALMKKFTNYYHLNHFVDGDFTFSDGEYTFNTRLYESKYGKLISKNTFKGSDVFILTDEITIKIKEDVGIPKSHIDNSNDLPVAGIFTNSIKSLEYFSAGHRELLFHNWQKGIEYFEMAVGEDPGFSVCYLTLVNYYFNSNQPEKAATAIQSAMDNIYMVPERTQFQIKFFKYILEQKPDKAMAVIKMWVELFPYDIQAHSTLAQRYQMNNNIAGAISEYKAILNLDPEKYDYIITIGDLYEETGKPDSAILYYRMYAKQFPKDYKSYSTIGEHYLKIAEFDLAKEYFEKAILLEPSIIPLSIKIAKIESRTGNFDLAEKQLFELLRICKTKSDSADTYKAISKYFRLKGKVSASLNYFEKYIDLLKEFQPPLRVSVQRAFTIESYIEAGQEERAFEILKNIEADFEPPLDKIAAFGYLFAYLELEDADNAEKQIPDAEQLAKGFGEETLLANIYYAWGRIYAMRGEYEKALENHKIFYELQPTYFSMNIYVM